MEALAEWVERRWDAMEASWLRALEIEPRHVLALGSLGIGLCTLGRLDEAVPFFERARLADPLASFPYTLTGLGYATCGRLREAVHYLDDALAFERCTDGRLRGVAARGARRGRRGVRRADARRGGVRGQPVLHRVAGVRFAAGRPAVSRAPSAPGDTHGRAGRVVRSPASVDSTGFDCFQVPPCPRRGGVSGATALSLGRSVHRAPTDEGLCRPALPSGRHRESRCASSSRSSCALASLLRNARRSSSSAPRALASAAAPST